MSPHVYVVVYPPIAGVALRERGWRTRRGADRRVAKLQRRGINARSERLPLWG